MMTIREISNGGAKRIESFEGFSSKPYWDADGGVWTRGYGETEGITRNSPSISQAVGEANLRARLHKFYGPAIANAEERAKGPKPWSQELWDILYSIAWNLGTGILDVTHDFGRELRVGNLRKAANYLPEYDQSGGHALDGLRTRRLAERASMLKAIQRMSPVPFVPADEKRWEREWDSHVSVIRRRVLRRTMKARAVSIEKVAKAQHNGWMILNRRGRFNSLNARTS